MVDIALDKHAEVVEAFLRVSTQVDSGFTGPTFCSQAGFVPCVPELHELNVEIVKFNSSHPGCVFSVENSAKIICLFVDPFPYWLHFWSIKCTYVSPILTWGSTILK